MEKEPKFVPDEIWSHIFEIGAKKSSLDVRDICSLSLTCKNFEKLCKDDEIWSALSTQSFPPRHRICYALLMALCDEPFVRKNLYKYKLKKCLRRKVACIHAQISADKNYYLPLCANDIKLAQDDIDDAHDIDLAQDLYAMENSLDESLMDYREQHDWMILMNKQLKEYSQRLLDMIRTGQDDGLSCQAPLVPTARLNSMNGSSSSTTPDSCFLDHAFAILKTTIEKQEMILAYLLERQDQIDFLLLRLQGHEKDLVRITTQMSSLTYLYEDKYPLTEEDLDDTDDENDAEEEDNGSDYDYL